MTDRNRDIIPSHDFDTATLRVVLVDLSLVERLDYVEEQSGNVADNEHDDYRTQSPG